ncbi:MAG: prephenate dehydrogenase [Eubacterium aggregans]|uniref:prephenate dehydrogenase n=1 Tax=Eubacterium aggregans TaxID=81409 RepID=UPI0023F05C78|nr:prephenate dehydrogenase [Eubacterium aggregans]MDD4691057.1 prephenate dehydrogenase [Eubacterium aggregans]MEA5072889.1 prephenate dehydrogenase [Eubacterium aggregans]
MKNLAGKNIAIIGLGLMGGALAMGLRKQGPARIGAFDINEEVLETALQDKVIDWGESTAEGVAEMLSHMDLVIFCLYPKQTVDFIITHMADFKEKAVLTDITGVKQVLIDALSPCIRSDLDFILGHPMAGSEKEGYGGADDTIFKGRNYILIPREKNHPENITWLKAIIGDLGFANIVETTPEIHDQKIAFTSQLCHVIACALIDSEEDRHISDFEGGSFCDLTRIAMINAEMWTELFMSNKKALLTQIEKFEEALDCMKTEIANSEDEALKQRLQDVRRKRVAMEIDRQNKKARMTPNLKEN